MQEFSQLSFSWNPYSWSFSCSNPYTQVTNDPDELQVPCWHQIPMSPRNSPQATLTTKAKALAQSMAAGTTDQKIVSEADNGPHINQNYKAGSLVLEIKTTRLKQNHQSVVSRSNIP